MLWPHSHAIANHFPIGHPSFHYSSSSTLNSGVLSGCVPEKEAPEEKALNFVCAMLENPYAVLQGSRHMAAVDGECSSFNKSNMVME
ncbi:hypothetical protein YC2023_094909 [Brassica napus]